MNRNDLRTQLAALDLSGRPEEAISRGRMLALLQEQPQCFVRTCFPAHFTGSALLLSADGQQALLHHHRKLNRWLQFGGHCDGDENVLRVALREAEEESGLTDLCVIESEPLDLDIHEIPERQPEPVHEHYDITYLLAAPPGAQPVLSAESHELRWVTPAEAWKIVTGVSLRRLIAKWAQRVGASLPL